MKQKRSGGGLAALRYSLAKGREAGGVAAVTKRLATRNTCKTCAVGMGGQQGGMRNEAGTFPEVCKKSVQAQAADMQPPIGDDFLRAHDLASLERWTSRELEHAGPDRLPDALARRRDALRARRLGRGDRDRRGRAPRGAARSHVLLHVGPEQQRGAFLLQCFARVYGTNNVNNCSFYCHQASTVALGDAIGSNTATVVLDDLAQADLVVVIGANPASNHPRLITQLVELRRRGGKVLVINPYREVGLQRFRVPSDWRSMLFGSDVSDLYLQPHVGSDVALLLWLLRRLIEREAVDDAYLHAHTTGWEPVRAAAAGPRPRCAPRRVRRAARRRRGGRPLVAGAQRGIIAWSMGITQHANGVDNVRAIINLALARGWVGRPGGGLLPIRGHSNVQGVGSVGVAPVSGPSSRNGSPSSTA
jgi:hypothetical protein